MHLLRHFHAFFGKAVIFENIIGTTEIQVHFEWKELMGYEFLFVYSRYSTNTNAFGVDTGALMTELCNFDFLQIFAR